MHLFCILGFQTEVWNDWGQWYKLAIAGLAMVSLEAWLFEFGTIAAGMNQICFFNLYFTVSYNVTYRDTRSFTRNQCLSCDSQGVCPDNEFDIMRAFHSVASIRGDDCIRPNYGLRYL